MKKLIKIISFVLSISLLSSTLVYFSFANTNRPKTDVPVVYVYGQGERLGVKVADTGDEMTDFVQEYPVTISGEYLQEKIEKYIGVFMKALASQEWDEFCDAICDCVVPIYGKLALDNYGNSTNGIELARYDDLEYSGPGPYYIREYTFVHDYRMDPYKTADLLHHYIEEVLRLTGKDEVVIASRCQGCSVVTAYLDKYDGEYVSKCIYYCSALKGSSIFDIFGGKLYLEPDALQRFVTDMKLGGEDDEMTQVIDAFVEVANEMGILDFLCWSINNVWPEISKKLMPQLMTQTFGTFPGMWAMVDDAYYEDAKELIFNGCDMEYWKPFIDIIDNYHYNCMNKSDEIIDRMEAKGIKFYNIVKYGYQAIPLTEGGEQLSDDLVYVDKASFGTTVVKDVYSHFSDSYIKKAVENGTDKYISPDYQIDASTDRFKDTTWYVKNCRHKEFEWSVENLMAEIANHEDFNVNSSDEYPQYLVYDPETEDLYPMTKENMSTTDKWIYNLRNSLRIIFNFIKGLIKNAINSKKDTAAQALTYYNKFYKN